MAYWEKLKQFGPIYPNLGASVAKFRRKPFAELDKATRRNYGLAVCKAILALQRSELQRELPSHASPCPSRTWHSDGEAILAAVRAQHRSALQAHADAVRRNRTELEWQTLYDAAMADKRRRELQAA